jgi:hypothetical protein
VTFRPANIRKALTDPETGVQDDGQERNTAREGPKRSGLLDIAIRQSRVDNGRKIKAAAETDALVSDSTSGAPPQPAALPKAEGLSRAALGLGYSFCSASSYYRMTLARTVVLHRAL